MNYLFSLYVCDSQLTRYWLSCYVDSPVWVGPVGTPAALEPETIDPYYVDTIPWTVVWR